jgi:hypothetical protein
MKWADLESRSTITQIESNLWAIEISPRWSPCLYRSTSILEYSAIADERLSPDLLRGRGKSIGGDLNVDDEGSEQNFEPLQSLHHCSVGYQSMRH